MRITLCGSTRFMARFAELNVQLSKMGHVVYSVATSDKGDFAPTEEEKIILDLVHLKKIENSDAIVVIGAQPDNTFYLGFSTKREIQWALMCDKSVISEKEILRYSNDPTPVDVTKRVQNHFDLTFEHLLNCCNPVYKVDEL